MRTSHHFRTTVVLAAMLPILGVSAVAGADEANSSIERGRYIVKTSGCNDCHTPGYPESGGILPESDWLTGNTVGFQGPWGTTYAANLRLTVAQKTEVDWVAKARSATRPPMPWFALRDMSDSDLKAVYRFIRSLGAKGEPAPDYAPPGDTVATPFIEFVPKNLAEGPLTSQR